MFDPEAILYRVWQRDIPPTWHVYPRQQLRAWTFGCAFSLLIMLAALFTFLIIPQFWLHNMALFIGIILVAIVMGSLFLALGVRQGKDFPISANPEGVLVIMPEGVVEYISTHVPIYTLPFAEIGDLQRYQEGKRAWLEVISHDSSESQWLPRATFGSKEPGYTYEVIFRHIIDAFERYKLGDFEEMHNDGGNGGGRAIS